MNPLANNVFRAVAELRPGCAEISEHTTLAELGCDSLDRLTLALAVEHHTGVTLPDRVLPRLRTVGDVLAAVAKGVSS